MTDGARTRDHWNHNPGLYQLSYSHHSSPRRLWAGHVDMVTPPGTPGCGAPGGTRTPDPRLRRPLLYPAELRALVLLFLLARAGYALLHGPQAKHLRNGRSGGIRTPDILLPKQTRYQTALHSADTKGRNKTLDKGCHSRGAHHTHHPGARQRSISPISVQPK